MKVGTGDNYMAYHLRGVYAEELIPLEPNGRAEPAKRGVEKMKRAIDKRRSTHGWK